jgi:hypothetical protein
MEDYWNGSFTLIFVGPPMWSKGIRAVEMDILLSFSLAHNYDSREWRVVGMNLLEWRPNLKPCSRPKKQLTWNIHSKESFIESNI